MALIGKMCQQERLCDLLLQNNVMTEENKGEVMCGKTNGARNRTLVEIVRCRFTRAFKVFCDGLDLTCQHDLLELMDPHRETLVPKTDSVECKVCLSMPVRIAFQPCGHACCCQTCADQITQCPLCRASIQNSIIVYM